MDFASSQGLQAERAWVSLPPRWLLGWGLVLVLGLAACRRDDSTDRKSAPPAPVDEPSDAAVDAPRPQYVTLAFTIRIRFKHVRTHELVHELKRTGTMTVRAKPWDTTSLGTTGTAAQIELPLNDRLKVCLRVFGAEALPSPRLEAVAVGNWTLDFPGRGSPDVLTLPLSYPPSDGSIGANAIFGELEYRADGAVEVVALSDEPTTTGVTAYQPQGELADCSTQTVALTGIDDARPSN